MLPERWHRLQGLFEAAADLPVDERSGYLDRECAGEPELRREVEELLAAEGDEDDPIESAIRHVAGEISDEADSPAAGGRIGPYEIVEPLGRGGMGSVFLARRVDEAYDKRVAIKLIRGGPHDPEQLLRFRMERQILANLDHPHIARVLDGGTTDDGDPFVVMEYVPGEPIDRYCDRYGLSVRRRVELFITVCDAVQCAHRNLVVHRDLKPSNILVNQVGEVKLLDFGIAKLLDPAQMPHTVVETRSAVRMMTPEFAAPEQVRGEPVTTATDVYALGVLLYQVLSGARPYRLESYRPQEIERVVCESQPVRPSAAVGRAEGGAGSSDHEPLDRTHGSPADRVRRELAGDLDNIVLKALRKEPARRYASAEQLAGDLRRFLEGRPVEARPDTWRYRSSKFLRRHVWSVSAGALFVAVLIAFAVTMTIQAARVTRQRDAAALERSRAERVASFLLDVFEVANPEQNRGETVTARELVDRGAARVREELKDDPKLLSELLNTIGDVYTKLALYDRAAELLEESVSACRVGYGPTAPECAKSLNNLGMVQQQLGDYDAAERSIRAGLELVEAAHGEEHVDTIASLNNLARVQQAKGDFVAAEATYRRCLELCDRIGEGGLGLAIQLDNLAQLLDAAGRPAEAEPLLRRSLELSESTEGKDSARVSVTLNTLGGVEFGLGNLEESEALYRRSLAISTRIYGPDHPETMTARNNLALVLDDRGDLAGAETELRAVLEATRHALGDEHPDVATVMGNLAGVLRREGKMDEAEGYYRDALAMSRRTLGDNHLDVGIRLNNLARFLQDAGRPAEAVEAYRRSLEIIEANVGRDHPYYPAALGNLALALKDAGRGDEAVATATRALELREAADGEQSRSAADGLTTLAETLIAVGRNEEAERQLEAAVPIYREVMPEGHPRVARALEGLGRLYLDEGRADDAEPLLREALEIRSKAMTEGVDLAEAQLDLGDCLAVLGREAEAATLLRQGIATLAPARGDDDTRIAEARARLAGLSGG